MRSLSYGMLSFRLWRALQHPPIADPVFEYAKTAHQTPRRRLSTTHWFALGVLAVVFLSALTYFVFPRPVGCAGRIGPWLITNCNLFGLILGTSPWVLLFVGILGIVVILNGFFQGLIAATTASHTIERERTTGRYELLSVLPFGRLFVDWALCTGALHAVRTGHMRQPVARYIWVLRVPFIVLLALLFALALLGRASTVGVIALSCAIAIGLYFEDRQSLVLGNLAGMVIPAYVRDVTDRHLSAAVGYVSLQFMMYAVTFSANGFMLPDFFDALGLRPAIVDVALPLAGLVIFITLRELVIMTMWYFFTRQVRAEPPEVLEFA